jgi:hypothetical protein
MNRSIRTLVKTETSLNIKTINYFEEELKEKLRSSEKPGTEL